MNNYGRFALFSVIFTVSYTLCFYFNIALFKYYPLVAQFHLDAQPKTSGPPISWYGWLAVAALASVPVALIVPPAWGNRIPPTVAWLVPAIVLVAVLVYEKRWFT
jgi:hypothetical protein